jgi:hypothetical protein
VCVVDPHRLLVVDVTTVDGLVIIYLSLLFEDERVFLVTFLGLVSTDPCIKLESIIEGKKKKK